jgi:hypothetical protein
MPVTDGSASSSFRLWISGKSATGAVRARARGSGTRASTGLGLEVDENINRPTSQRHSERETKRAGAHRRQELCPRPVEFHALRLAALS